MNKTIATLALVLGTLLCGNVLAYSISASYSGIAAGGSVYRSIDGRSYRLAGGQMRFDDVVTDFPLQSIGTQTLYGWCVEPFESIGYGSADWALQDLQHGATNIGGMGQQRANYLRELFHYVAPDLSQVANRNVGLALQIATWEIVRDDALGNFNVSSGNAWFRYSYPSSAISLAQGWLDDVINDGVQGPMLDNLYAATRDGRQDMVFQLVRPQNSLTAKEVPLPAPVWLLASGFGLLQLRRRLARG